MLKLPHVDASKYQCCFEMNIPCGVFFISIRKSEALKITLSYILEIRTITLVYQRNLDRMTDDTYKVFWSVVNLYNFGHTDTVVISCGLLLVYDMQ